MALVRMIPLKDFTATALSSGAVTTGYNLGALTTQQKAYAALHLTSGYNSTDRTLNMTIQSATASAFGAPSTRFTFTRTTREGAEWGTPVGGLSTEHKWWRAVWTASTGGSTSTSTSGTWKGLVEMGIR